MMGLLGCLFFKKQMFWGFAVTFFRIFQSLENNFVKNTNCLLISQMKRISRLQTLDMERNI